MRVVIKKKVDKLGRITIPINLRRFYNLEAGQEVAVIDTDDGILIFNPEKIQGKE